MTTPDIVIPERIATLLWLVFAGCGAATALVLLSLAVWTARDVAARARERWARWGAVALVLVFNVFGLLIYLLLRPRDTLAERREREMIEEILARELNAAALARAQAGRPALRPLGLAARPPEG